MSNIFKERQPLQQQPLQQQPAYIIAKMTFKPFKHPLFDKLNTKRFILASTSPRRIEILEQMGFKNVEVIPSNFEENLKKEDYEPKEVSVIPLYGV